MVKGGKEELTEEERKALRGSKFAPLPPPSLSRPSSSSSSSLPRIAHPGGPVKTNKAVALAKFLERKLQEPGGLDSLNPELVELAVKNAKDTVKGTCCGGTSKHGISIQHVTSFDDSEDSSSMDDPKKKKHKKEKKPKKVKKKKQQKNKKKLKAQNLDC